MVPQQPAWYKIAMLGFLFGFAQIKAEDIPDGVMPKRQVVGTGVSTTTSATQQTTPSTSPTSATQQTSPTSNTQQTSPTSATQQTSPTSNTAITPTPGSTSESTSDSTSDNNTPSSASQSQQQSQQQVSSSATIPTTIAVTTTNSDGSTITSSIATSTLAAVKSTKSTDSVISTESGSSSNLVKVGSSTINRSTLSHATVVTEALVAKHTEQSTFTSYWTSNGQVLSSVVTTENVVASTTGFATATIAPSLTNGGGNGSNLTENTKKIVGGVVGGIGGAILIGGLALVAWRLWGKKRRAAERDEFLDSQDDSIRREKIGSVQPVVSGDGSERYHNPNGAVNTASNF